MKQWFKENTKRIVLSSVVTLLPILYGILFWDKLPDSFTTHWGADGVADGASGKAFVVFGIPAIFLAVNLLCAFCTYFDKNNRQKNQKAMGVVFWIMPMLSVLINSIVYKSTAADGPDFFWLFFVIFGVLFLILGNYMPKISKNRTLGIKIKWTLCNEENWNKTHRLAGRIWVAGGILMLATVFLPMKWGIGILLATILTMIIVPYAYSYSIYRKHKAQGISYANLPKTKGDKVGIWITAIVLPIILIGTTVLMFTGSIQYEFTEDSLKIDATYGDFSVVGYEFIDTVEFRDDFEIGSRNYGFGSAKLSLGNFRNEEFGNYTLYAYNRCNSAVVIKSGEHILVITGKDTAETQALYDALTEKIK